MRMKRTSLFMVTGMIALSSLVFMGAGCPKNTPSTPKNTNTTNAATTNSSNSNNSASTVDLEELDDPSGDPAQDQQAVEDALKDLNSASENASSAIDDVDNGESVDSYELPQDIE